MVWGQNLWGEGLWGEQDPIILGDFVDAGGNALVLPASIDFLGFSAPESEEFARNVFYEMHLASMRQIDERQGAFFWKRFCEGPEYVRKWLDSKIDELDTLYNIETISDEFVRLMLPQVGWTNEFNSITDKLTDAEVRALIANSATLWKNRGSAGSFIEVLNTIIGIDAWEWSWFDRRWVLGSARLGQDEDPDSWTDLRFTNTASRSTSELRIADPNRTLDRDLIADVLKFWRPTGERISVVFVEFWDRFVDGSKPWVQYDSQSPAGSVAISGGTIQLSNSLVEQHAFPETPAVLLSLESSMVKARVRSSSATGYYGVSVGFDGTFATSIEVRLYPEFHELRAYQNAGLLFTFDLIHDYGITLVPNSWYTLRVVADGQRAVIYLDNVKISEANAMGLLVPGTSGVLHGVGSTMECDHFEIIPIPGEAFTVGINS